MNLVTALAIIVGLETGVIVLACIAYWAFWGSRDA